MPPKQITEITNPDLAIKHRGEPIFSAAGDAERGALAIALSERLPVPSVHTIDMNVAETYGIDWTAEKCARDAFQNFFDENNGTLDGIRSYKEEVPGPEGGSMFAVSIEGDSNYDYRQLTVIGATGKSTGGQTAGGFGEGAKFLALSLLRDHGAERVVYRSRDWQLEFYIDDFDEDKVAQPTRGLFARVATGLEYVDGSSMVIASGDESTVDSVTNGRELFRSSENIDFSDNVLEKTLPDGTQIGVKFLGIKKTANRFLPDGLNKGHLYVAGQRRHYSAHGRDVDGWDTVSGISLWTTKDIVPGDRDRGMITRDAIKDEIIAPLVEVIDQEDIERFFEEIEPAYSSSITSTLTDELGMLAEQVARKGGEMGVELEFDPKYVSVSGYLATDIRTLLEDNGYVLCGGYYSEIGMKTSGEVIKAMHEHQRIEPTPEQQGRINLLHEAIDAFGEATSIKKDISNKDIWLYSKELEGNPFEGSYDEEFVWISEEWLGRDFPTVFATYLHELDHKHGSDHSASFTYALTDTLAEVINVLTSDPELAQKFNELRTKWDTKAADLEHFKGNGKEKLRAKSASFATKNSGSSSSRLGRRFRRRPNR